MHRSTKAWAIRIVLMVGVFALTLARGLESITRASFRTEASLVGELFVGPIQLLLPVVATLICAPGLSAALNNRFIVSVRTRASVRRYLLQEVARRVAACFALLFGFGVIVAVIGYGFAPLWYPDAIDPAAYNLTADDALAQEAAKAPLAALLAVSPAVYVLATGAWMGVHAALFGLIAALAAILVVRSFIAWIVPLALFLAQSVILSVLGMPAAAFLRSAAYPDGLQSYPLAQSLMSLIVGLVVAAAVFVVVLARADHAERFA